MKPLRLLEIIINYILNRFKESNTWAGLIGVASYYGFKMPVEQAMTIAGFIIVMLPNAFDLDGNGKIDTD